MSHSFLAFINSPAQLMVISVLVLILFGAKKLPMFARSLGRSMGEFKRARDEFERELHSAVEEPQRRIEEPQRPVEAPKADVAEAQKAPTTPPPAQI